MRHLKVFLLVFSLIAFAAASPRAETILIEPFSLENEEVPVPCDVEELLKDNLIGMGCDMVRQPVHSTPDIVITGSYLVSDGHTFATIRASDTVNSQVISARNVYLPLDDAQCRELITEVTEEIANPPFYARKRNFFDADTRTEFVYVPGGSYRMGYADKEGDWTTVGNFFMARHEITQEQWSKFMDFNPSVYNMDPRLPVENVSWYDAKEFVRRISEKTGRRYRLPTEAEWEYAARTRGRTYKWSGTSQESNLDYFAWTRENSEDRTHIVGTKRANGLGLFDMSGNVWEWCEDRVLTSGSTRQAGGSAENRVIRGGSWMLDRSYARAYARDVSSPESRFKDNGFRIVLEVIEHKEELAKKPKQPRKAETPPPEE